MYWYQPLSSTDITYNDRINCALPSRQKNVPKYSAHDIDDVSFFLTNYISWYAHM